MMSHSPVDLTTIVQPELGFVPQPLIILCVSFLLLGKLKAKC